MIWQAYQNIIIVSCNKSIQILNPKIITYWLCQFKISTIKYFLYFRVYDFDYFVQHNELSRQIYQDFNNGNFDNIDSDER